MKKNLLFPILLAVLSSQFCSAQQQPFYDLVAGNGNGLRLWGLDEYKIHMGIGTEYGYGPVTGYSIKSNMQSNTGWGWTWGTTNTVPIAGLSSQGNMQIAGSFKSSTISLGTALNSKKIAFWDDPSNWYGLGIEGGQLRFQVAAGGKFSFLLGDNTELATIMHTGNVGIGTATPAYKLDVAGTINASGILINGVPFAGGGSQWATNGTSVNFSGNVGIGTTSPGYKLDVAGTINASAILINGQPVGSGGGGSSQWTLSGNDITNSNAAGKVYVTSTFNGPKLHVHNGLQLGSTAGSNQLISRFGSNCGSANNAMNSHWITRDAAGDSWLTTRFHDGISIDGSYLNPGVDTRVWWERDAFNNIQSWGDQNATYMTINQGNVGIGTLNPNQKLTVKGIIYGSEVRVDVNVPGPDYVFEESYDLPSLEEVKSYIDENKHLPEVPSAAEMEKNGINLSEMNMLLLKKVEELTLYVLELKKESKYQAEKFQLQLDELKVKK